MKTLVIHHSADFDGIFCREIARLHFAVRPEHEGLFGFNWTGKKWRVSLYHAPHRTDIDLSVIAVKYGGGGHRGACGFRCDKLPFLP
jgi:hypothetical protein